MGDEMLAGVCELAFDVAKEGSAPSAMKNYLYLAQRPPRAYSVAQRALEEDASFRARVAERATIENVGEAGYLWLHRPSGWEQRFSDLRSGVDPISAPTHSETPLEQRPPMPAPPLDDPAPVGVTNPGEAASDPGLSTGGAAENPVQAAVSSSGPPVHARSNPAESAGPAPTVSSIEDELSSLRGLVDRLADERQNVRSSVSELEVELETRRAENLEMSTKLSALRTELSSVQSSESTILLDRDRALARIAELEADVARLTAEVERMAAEAEGSSAEHEAALTDLAVVSSERQALADELDNVRSERDALADAATQRDGLQSELDAVITDRNGLTSELTEVRTDRDRLAALVTTTTNERDELRQELDAARSQAEADAERIADNEQLREDNTELAARLSVAEQARIDLESQLEDVSQKWQTSTRQLSVFENVNSQLDTAVAERDELEAKLVQADAALSELHRRIGTSHDQIRQELAGVEAAFGDSTVDADTIDPSAVSDEAPGGDETSDDAAVDAPDDLALGAIASGFETPADDSPLADAQRSLESLDDGFGSPELGSVGDIDVPSFEDEATDDVFDGQGIELDPAMLGGRTIGDMFGAGDDTDPTDAEADEAALDAGDNGTDITEVADDEVAGGPDTDTDADTDVDIDSDTDDRFDEVEVSHDTATPDQSEQGAVASTTGRRRLSLSPEAGDAAFAREVVEADDIVLLVDGDGAALLGWPHLDVATRRSALVGYLGSLTADSGAAADVVFSRPVGGEDALPVSRDVRVRIADDAVADSPIISSIVNGYPEEWPIAIVTDEVSIVERAASLDVVVMSNNQLLDLFLDLNTGEA